MIRVVSAAQGAHWAISYNYGCSAGALAAWIFSIVLIDRQSSAPYLPNFLRGSVHAISIQEIASVQLLFSIVERLMGAVLVEYFLQYRKLEILLLIIRPKHLDVLAVLLKEQLRVFLRTESGVLSTQRVQTAKYYQIQIVYQAVSFNFSPGVRANFSSQVVRLERNDLMVALLCGIQIV